MTRSEGVPLRDDTQRHAVQRNRQPLPSMRPVPIPEIEKVDHIVPPVGMWLWNWYYRLGVLVVTLATIARVVGLEHSYVYGSSSLVLLAVLSNRAAAIYSTWESDHASAVQSARRMREASGAAVMSIDTDLAARSRAIGAGSDDQALLVDEVRKEVEVMRSIHKKTAPILDSLADSARTLREWKQEMADVERVFYIASTMMLLVR